MTRKIFILILFISFMSLLETTFVSLPITLSSLVALAILVEGYPLLLAFVSGVILDLMAGRWFGMSSFFFIIVIFLIYIYRKKIVEKVFYYWIGLLSICVVLYNFIFLRKFSVIETIMSVMAGIVIFFLINMLVGILERGRKLKL